MGKAKRTKRAPWTEDMLTKALTAVKDGMSQRDAAEQFHIPRRTLRNHIKSGIARKTLGRKCVLTQDQEEDLVSRIIRYSEVGMPVTVRMLGRYVYQFCEENNITTPFNDHACTAGKDWIKAFLKRHPTVSQRKAQNMNPARAQKLNRFIVDDYFTKMERVQTDLQLFDKPNKIFNMDEKGCQLSLHHPQNVLAKKGSKRVHLVAPEHGENVTVVACGSASGLVIPPMVIFKGQRKKSNLADELPPGSAVVMAHKGCMTTSVFIRWIQHFAQFKPAGDVLLVYDGAASHLDPSIVDAADHHHIHLFCLPSNTTHELQPMDKSVFRSFETYWDEELLKFWRLHADRQVNKDRFGKIFTPAWYKAMTPMNVINGFKATGIYPFNKNAIPPEAFAPSDITFREGMVMYVLRSMLLSVRLNSTALSMSM